MEFSGSNVWFQYTSVAGEPDWNEQRFTLVTIAPKVGSWPLRSDRPICLDSRVDLSLKSESHPDSVRHDLDIAFNLS